MLSLKAKSEVVCFGSDEIPGVWDQVKPHIQRALDRGSIYSIEDIYTGLCDAKMQLWTWMDNGIEAALVTTIQEKDGIKYCLYLALGGENMAQWQHYMHYVEDWAKDSGCTEMRIYGRAGWARAFGFEIEYTKMSRVLK